MKIPSEFKFIQAIAVVLLAFTAVHAYADDGDSSECSALLNHEFKKLGEDERVNLCDAYAGKLILVGKYCKQMRFYASVRRLGSDLRPV